MAGEGPRDSGMADGTDRHARQTNFDMEAIFANWQFLAAVAWRGYEAHGRGAVVVSLDDWYADVDYASGPFPVSYAGFVERYDPLEQIVVVVRHCDGHQAYVLYGWPTPRDCVEADAASSSTIPYFLGADGWTH